MSHWAELDKDNKVIRVLVGDNNDPAGDEGYQWLIDNLGGTWIKTSYNGNIRYNFAGAGMTYDPDADAFIAPRTECGHKELFLNHIYKWTCQGCDLVAKEQGIEA
jgi:hypothetical protein